MLWRSQCSNDCPTRAAGVWQFAGGKRPDLDNAPTACLGTPGCRHSSAPGSVKRRNLSAGPIMGLAFAIPDFDR